MTRSLADWPWHAAYQAERRAYQCGALTAATHLSGSSVSRAGKDIADGTRFLRSDLSINCASPAHVGMTAYAVVMLFVYPFGAPALYAYLLFGRHV